MQTSSCYFFTYLLTILLSNKFLQLMSETTTPVEKVDTTSRSAIGSETVNKLSDFLEKRDADKPVVEEKTIVEEKKLETTPVAEGEVKPEAKTEEVIKLETEKKELEVTLEKAKEDKDKVILDQKAKEQKESTEWFEEGPKTASIEKTADTQKDDTSKLKAEIDALKEKVKESELLLSDPEMDAFISGKKAGKPLTEILKDIQGEDYSKWTPSQLFEKKLKELGLTDDDVIEAVDAFTQKPKWEQKEEANKLQETYSKREQEKLKKYSSANELSQKAAEDYNKRFLEETDSYLKAIENQDRFGMKITPEMTKSMDKSIKEGFLRKFMNEDGTLNLEKVTDALLWMDNKKLIVRLNVDKAKNAGRKEVIEEVTRPDAKVIKLRQPNMEGDKAAEFAAAANQLTTEKWPMAK